MIPLIECTKGHLYRINSRNLTLGVYDGESGFIGIRVKFGYRYLFTEYHWDTGSPFGTVQPQEDLGPIPNDLEVWESKIEGEKWIHNDVLFAYLDGEEAKLQKGGQP